MKPRTAFRTTYFLRSL